MKHTFLKEIAMEPFLGQITLFGFNFAPRGWAPCAGQMLPINQNQALFALIGTYFGGNGQTTFALPDLRGKGPDKSTQYCIALQGVFPSRD
jgi:microcystin-dependent protein